LLELAHKLWAKLISFFKGALFTMDVLLPPELEQFVATKIHSGHYNSASEVVCEAVQLLQEQDQLRQARLQELRRKITEGLEQLDRGESIPGDQVFAELEAELTALEQSGQTG
jgi:antitoxin ParD1/3/4